MNKWQTIILQLREKGLTQTQIANEIGCSQNYISNLENGLCGKRLSHNFGQKLELLQKKHSSSQSLSSFVLHKPVSNTNQN